MTKFSVIPRTVGYRIAYLGEALTQGGSYAVRERAQVVADQLNKMPILTTPPAGSADSASAAEYRLAQLWLRKAKGPQKELYSHLTLWMHHQQGSDGENLTWQAWWDLRAAKRKEAVAEARDGEGEISLRLDHGEYHLDSAKFYDPEEYPAGRKQLLKNVDPIWKRSVAEWIRETFNNLEWVREGENPKVVRRRIKSSGLREWYIAQAKSKESEYIAWSTGGEDGAPGTSPWTEHIEREAATRLARGVKAKSIRGALLALGNVPGLHIEKQGSKYRVFWGGTEVIVKGSQISTLNLPKDLTEHIKESLSVLYDAKPARVTSRADGAPVVLRGADLTVRTCPVCFRAIKATYGSMADHGYTLAGRHGEWYRPRMGGCFGVGKLPWERSPEGLVAGLKLIEAQINELRSPVLPVQLSKQDFRGETISIREGDAEWDAALQGWLRGRDRNIADMWSDSYPSIPWLRAAVRTWEAVPDSMPAVGAPQPEITDEDRQPLTGAHQKDLLARKLAATDPTLLWLLGRAREGQWYGEFVAKILAVNYRAAKESTE